MSPYQGPDLPAGQLTQVDELAAPIAVLYFPTAQRVHVEEPAVGLYDPGSQLSQ